MTGLTVTPDEINPSRHDVTHGEQHLGVIFDETPAALTRGGWAAWSPKAGTRNGIVGFFGSKEEAAAAIAKTHSLDVEAEAEAGAGESEEHCMPVMGGKVHSLMPGSDHRHVFPLCRTGGSTNRGTRYRLTRAPLTCSTCLMYAERRKAARTAPC
ncbi:hypothetical protein ABZ543_08240 [Streptomyces roseifaciens]